MGKDSRVNGGHISSIKGTAKEVLGIFRHARHFTSIAALRHPGIAGG